jgi:hypothetical protein
MSLLAALPFGLELGIVLAVLVPASLIGIAFGFASKIQVTDNLVRGRFRIPLRVMRDFEIFEGEAARLERGPNLDARAQIAIRGDIDKVVKIWLSDPEDPTPYVLLSSRKPTELVSALRANRASLGL